MSAAPPGGLLLLLLAGCGPGIGPLPGKGLVVRALSQEPSFQLVLEYVPGPKSCEKLEPRVSQNGKELKPSDPGGPQEDGSCGFPSWPALAQEPSTPFVTFRLEDYSALLQVSYRNLLAKRSLSLLAPASAKARALDWVELEYGPETDALSELEIHFLADGSPENLAVVWLNAQTGQAAFEKNRVRVAIPGRQTPARGRLRLSAAARPELYACDGVDRCRVEDLRFSLDLPFEVTP